MTMQRVSGYVSRPAGSVMLTILALVGVTWAAEPAPATTGEGGAYHTSMAGESFRTVFMGQEINIPARDRNNLTTLTLGSTFYFPHQGDNMFSPIFDLYLKRKWSEEQRLRAIVSIFVNDVEYDKGFKGSPFEFVTLFNNNTIPGGQTEVINNTTQNWSSVIWGTVNLMLGPGLRIPVAPLQADNDLRLQLLGKAGYFYVRSDGDTGKINDYPVIDYRQPSSTWTYGMKFRGRYDGLRRNLLELPHQGLAAGFDIDYTYRANWNEWSGVTSRNINPSHTRNYAQFTGYILGVTPIPGLSEKNVILASVYGGGQDSHSADRFNALRIGGGPLPGESDDLYRVDYPGTMFNNIYVSNYTMATVEYRRELAFFMYLHLRGSFIWAQQFNWEPASSFNFRRTNGQCFTLGLDSGFLWDSSLYLGYNWDSGFIRDGQTGSGIILTWNKSF